MVSLPACFASLPQYSERNYQINQLFYQQSILATRVEMQYREPSF